MWKLWVLETFFGITLTTIVMFLSVIFTWISNLLSSQAIQFSSVESGKSYRAFMHRYYGKLLSILLVVNILFVFGGASMIGMIPGGTKLWSSVGNFTEYRMIDSIVFAAATTFNVWFCNQYLNDFAAIAKRQVDKEAKSGKKKDGKC